MHLSAPLVLIVLAAGNAQFCSPPFFGLPPLGAIPGCAFNSLPNAGGFGGIGVGAAGGAFCGMGGFGGLSGPGDAGCFSGPIGSGNNAGQCQGLSGFGSALGGRAVPPIGSGASGGVIGTGPSGCGGIGGTGPGGLGGSGPGNLAGGGRCAGVGGGFAGPGGGNVISPSAGFGGGNVISPSAGFGGPGCGNVMSPSAGLGSQGIFGRISQDSPVNPFGLASFQASYPSPFSTQGPNCGILPSTQGGPNNIFPCNPFVDTQGFSGQRSQIDVYPRVPGFPGSSMFGNTVQPRWKNDICNTDPACMVVLMPGSTLKSITPITKYDSERNLSSGEYYYQVSQEDDQAPSQPSAQIIGGLNCGQTTKKVGVCGRTSGTASSSNNKYPKECPKNPTCQQCKMRYNNRQQNCRG